jgi:uncharacterized protein GlcG (DUF336 family)
MMKQVGLPIGLCFLAAGASAQPASPAAQPPAGRSPGLSLAVEVAQAAMAACLSKNFRTVVVVANETGTPVVMLAADRTSARLQQVVGTKVATVAKYRIASGEIVKKAAADPAFAAELQANPAIGMARAGALPISVGDAMVGIIAVGGATPSEADTACAEAGVAALTSRVSP